ncbi:MAG: class I SAM-dependent methyltransferase [Clostridia bacterium]
MEALEQHIREECEQSPSRMIPFVRFMEQALYHPQYGYYTVNRTKVGKTGDFFTSATVHPVFAETIADTIADLLEKIDAKKPTLVEIGGGTGYLLKHLLARLEQTRPKLFAELQVIVIESSPYHRKLQAEAIGCFSVEVVWFASLADAAAAGSVEGVIFSNEWLDAFPVHLLQKNGKNLQEVGVYWDEKSGSFAEGYLPEVTEEVALLLQESPIALESRMRIELNLGMRQAVRELSQLLAKGVVLTIDYGDMQAELYHPSRNRGTLMCYYQHRAHENPFVHIGEQDLTAHVNFTQLQTWGEEVGLLFHWYGRQDRFLIQSGILDRLRAHQDRDPFSSEAMKQNRAIQQLILPGGMGGVFRVMVQTKGLPADTVFAFQKKKDALG